MLVGQTSLWPVLGWAGCFWALEKKRDDLAGLFLTLTAIKPHIGYLLYPVLLIWMIRTRRFRSLISGFLGLALLSLLTEMLHPGVFMERFHMKATPLALAAATLETQIRLILFRIYGQNMIWPALAVPLLAIIVAVFYYWRRPVILKNAVPPLLCISLLTAPYGGINDFNLLAITQTAWLGKIMNISVAVGTRRIFLFCLAAFHLLTLSFYLLGMNGFHDLWWYPFIALLLWDYGVQWLQAPAFSFKKMNDLILMKNFFVRSLISWMVLGIILFVMIQQGLSLLREPFFMQDFSGYWTAFQLFKQQLNPYDANLLMLAQQGYLPSGQIPFYVWYSPYFFILSAPMLCLSYFQAKVVWFLAQVACAIFSIKLCWKYFGISQLSRKEWLLGMFFMPVYNSLFLGQLGGFLILSTVAFFYFLKIKKDWMAGLCFSILLLKPHLLWLLYPILGVWIVTHRRWTVPVATLGWMGLFGVAVLMFHPSILQLWLQAYHQPPANYWATPTLSYVIRMALSHYSGTIPFWPLWAVPAFTFVGYGVYLWKRRCPIVWENDLPGLICLSLLTSSYGWIADQSLLIIPYIAVFQRIFRIKESKLKNSLYAINVGLQILILFLPYQYQQQFYWIPIGQGAVGLLVSCFRGQVSRVRASE